MYARIRGTVLTIAAVFWLFAADAQSQDMLSTPNYVDAWHQSYIMTYPLRNRSESVSREANVTEPSKRARSITSASSADLARALSFRPSPAVTSAINAAFADVLTGQRTVDRPGLLGDLESGSLKNGPFVALLAKQAGNDRASVLETLQSGDLQAKYNQWLKSSGHSSASLLDVHSAFLMHAWAVANNGVMTADSDEAFDAVREELLNALVAAKSPLFASGNDAEKQKEAESFALLTILIVTAWQNTREPAEKATLRAGVDALGRQLGVNLQAVALTRDGFAAKR